MGADHDSIQFLKNQVRARGHAMFVARTIPIDELFMILDAGKLRSFREAVIVAIVDGQVTKKARIYLQ
jgi:hypothetical protein